MRSALPSDFIPDESDVVIQALGTDDESFAAAAALHDKTGTWEHNRKILLAELREKHRAVFAKRNERITEGRLDDLAHSDPTYKRFVIEGTAAKTQYHLFVARRIEHYTRLKTLNYQGMR